MFECDFKQISDFKIGFFLRVTCMWNANQKKTNPTATFVNANSAGMDPICADRNRGSNKK